MFGSVLPACDMTGVSTSSTPRWARNSRTAALSRARRRSASNVAEGCQSLIGSDRGKTVFGIHTRSSVFGEESQQPGLVPDRSEEHTSELQSLMRISYAVFCLKKKKHQTHTNTKSQNKHITQSKK